MAWGRRLTISFIFFSAMVVLEAVENELSASLDEGRRGRRAQKTERRATSGIRTFGQFTLADGNNEEDTDLGEEITRSHCLFTVNRPSLTARTVCVVTHIHRRCGGVHA